MRNDFEAAVLAMSLEQKMLLLDFINHLEQGRAGKREMGSCEHLGNKQGTNGEISNWKENKMNIEFQDIELENLREQILEMIDKLSAADCAEVFAALKERGVL